MVVEKPMKKKQNRARGKCEYIQTKQTNIIKKCEKEKDRQGNPYTHTLLRRRRIYGKKKSKSKTKQKIIMRIKYEMQEYWRRKKKTATQTIVRKT